MNKIFKVSLTLVVIVAGTLLLIAGAGSPRYVGRFFGDGAGVTNIPQSGVVQLSNSLYYLTNAAVGGATGIMVLNGFGTNTTLNGVTTTNLVNYGNPISSRNITALATEQFGAGSSAIGLGATALGNSAQALDEYSLAVGYGSEASGGYGPVSIGVNSEAIEDGAIAIGVDSSAAHTNSVAIGNSATTTEANQIMMGTATEQVRVPGTLSVSGNLTGLGTSNRVNNLYSDNLTTTTLGAENFYPTNTYWLPTAVASLPTPGAGLYAIKYSTNVVTSQGTGDFVKWDGSNWRTLTDGAIATASLTNFVLNAVEAGINSDSKVGIYRFQPRAYVSATGLDRNNAQAGTGAGSGFSDSADYGSTWYLEAGTVAAGNARQYGVKIPALAAGEVAHMGGAYYVDVLPDGTDNYFVCVGMNSVNTTNFPSTGCGFVFDMYDETPVVSNATFTATWTNNWIAMTGTGGSYTFVDTGLPVTTVAATPNRLLVINANDATLFYTNGVLCTTITANRTATTMFLDKIILQKTAGTTDRFLYEVAPHKSYRHVANIYP